MSRLTSKRIFFLGFFLFCLTAIAADINISGVDGKVLKNVQHRLTELYPGKSILKESSETIRTQVEKALMAYGYFHPDISVKANRAGYPNVRIHSGPIMRIITVDVSIVGEGRDNAVIQKAAHRLPIKAGDPFNAELYNESKEALTNVAENQGYLHGVFETSTILMDRNQDTAKITICFNTGPQFYFGQLRFDPTYISPDLLARYVPFKPGQAYSTDKLLNLDRNLSNSGYFKSVNVKPLIGNEQEVPIDVNLTPVNRLNYTLGLGYGTDTGPRGLAGINIIPVNRAGHKFSAGIQGSTAENAFQAQYTIPGKNPITDKYSLGGSFTNLNYNVGFGNAGLISLAQQHVTPRLQRILSLNGLNDSFSYKNADRQYKTLFYPKALFSFTQAKDQLFSPSGHNVSISGLASTRAFLSQLNIAQGSIDAKAALTLDKIRTRFYVHAIQGVTLVNDVTQIPLSLAQLLGGANNLRGSNFNSIGPGRVITFGSVELQKETFKKWYALGFVDCGDVYKPDPLNFKYDAGLGLMWVSLIGPIKVGLAQPLNDRFSRSNDHAPKFVVSMGPDL